MDKKSADFSASESVSPFSRSLMRALTVALICMKRNGWISRPWSPVISWRATDGELWRTGCFEAQLADLDHSLPPGRVHQTFPGGKREMVEIVAELERRGLIHANPT